MKTLKTIAALTLASLAGCAATSPARIATSTPEELQSQTSEALCNAWGRFHPTKARVELERRGLLSAEEWRLIDAQHVAIGMSRLALICSWGDPGYTGAVNRTVSASGVSEQWVYRDAVAERTRYIYVRDGKVTGMQD